MQPFTPNKTFPAISRIYIKIGLYVTNVQFNFVHHATAFFVDCMLNILKIVKLRTYSDSFLFTFFKYQKKCLRNIVLLFSSKKKNSKTYYYFFGPNYKTHFHSFHFIYF